MATTPRVYGLRNAATGLSFLHRCPEKRMRPKIQDERYVISVPGNELAYESQPRTNPGTWSWEVTVAQPEVPVTSPPLELTSRFRCGWFLGLDAEQVQLVHSRNSSYLSINCLRARFSSSERASGPSLPTI
jgi:hypothetical protein